MRLIDADRLYDALADKLLWLMQYGDDTYLSVGDDIRKTIADQPTAYDVEKVAERLEEKVNSDFPQMGKMYYCTCGVAYLERGAKYCGNCGQRLEWEEES